MRISDWSSDVCSSDLLAEHPGPLVATVAIIVVGKAVAAYTIVRAFGHSSQTAMTIAASLAQIGEFSFILAGLGVGLKVMPDEARDLILAGAILSILFNPLFFALPLWWMRSEEIGRAACRERGCQDVEFSGVAGS